ncbi:hypothetical protein F4774DRAFT_163713 [Daldinia eschscholtzii]|nr:hypothetical protein F4774DRAFT_163713 [Daldinia eschscholtzii]
MCEVINNNMAIPGLHTNPTFLNMGQSTKLHNQLRDDADQPLVSDDDLKALAQIFVKYNAHKVFGVHLIHKHSELDINTVNLGDYSPELSGYWTKPVDLRDLDSSNIHGHIFALTSSGCFTAYEFRTGLLPKLSHIAVEFFDDVAEYLQSNQLGDVLGLEVLENEGGEAAFEFVMGQGLGTLMLAESKAYADPLIYRTTGWVFENDGAISCRGGAHHTKTTGGEHSTVKSGTVKTSSVEMIKMALLDAGIYR